MALSKPTQLTILKKPLSDLRDHMERVWLGKKTSVFGQPFIKLDQGLIKVKTAAQIAAESHIVMLIQLADRINIYIDFDHNYRIDVKPDTPALDSAATAQLTSQIEAIIADEKAYLSRERQFVQEQVWVHLDGLTVRQAIKKLQDLGW